jgi:hypothetical protein
MLTSYKIFARAAVVRGRFGRSGHKRQHEVAISNKNL